MNHGSTFTLTLELEKAASIKKKFKGLKNKNQKKTKGSRANDRLVTVEEQEDDDF